jgi:hypothetical protein
MDDLRKCQAENCLEKRRGRDKFCRSHGSTYRTCKKELCENWALNGGYCKEHGGVDWKKKCSYENCNVFRWRGLFCFRHRIVPEIDIDKRFSKPCSVVGCGYKLRMFGFCTKHAKEHNLVCIQRIKGRRQCGKAIVLGDKRCKQCSKL